MVEWPRWQSVLSLIARVVLMCVLSHAVRGERQTVEKMARIVLGVEEHDVAEQVMHFLDRTGRARVVATAGDERQLTEAVRQLEPDAVIASPALVRRGTADGSTLLALDTRESIASLRSALRAGADGYFVWPDERELLAGAAARVHAAPPVDGPVQKATTIAVYGPRGGAGTTFLATHLAAAFARRELGCVLVDMDPLFGDVSAAIGVPQRVRVDGDGDGETIDGTVDRADGAAGADTTGGAGGAGAPPRTVADLRPLVDELTPAHLDEVLWRHETGFRALLAPEPQDWPRLETGDYAAAVQTAATTADVVVLHLPRGLDELTRCGLDLADRVVVVLTLDVLGFRSARRALDAMTAFGLEGRCDLVVNRAARAEITPKDVPRVFGCQPTAVIPADPDVSSAQDRGRLLGARGRTARALDRLAVALLEDTR